MNYLPIGIALIGGVIYYCSTKKELSNDELKLIAAVISGRSEDVTELLKKGIDPNTTSKNGQPVLHMAIQSIKPDIVQILLDVGASRSLKDENNDSPLHIAAWFQGREVAGWLVINDIFINAQNKQGQTPLHIAAKKGDTDLVKLFLKYGADKTIMDSRQNTPIDVAIQCTYGEVVDILANHL